MRAGARAPPLPPLGGGGARSAVEGGRRRKSHNLSPRRCAALRRHHPRRLSRAIVARIGHEGRGSARVSPRFASPSSHRLHAVARPPPSPSRSGSSRSISAPTSWRCGSPTRRARFGELSVAGPALRQFGLARRRPCRPMAATPRRRSPIGPISCSPARSAIPRQSRCSSGSARRSVGIGAIELACGRARSRSAWSRRRSAKRRAARRWSPRWIGRSPQPASIRACRACGRWCSSPTGSRSGRAR